MSPRNPAPKKTAPHPPAVEPDRPIGEPTAAVATIDPPTPPPKKKAAPPKPSDLIIEEVGRERRLAEAREELHFRRHKMLADGLDLSPDEYRLLETAVPRSPNQNPYDFKEQFRHFLNREDTRVATIIKLQTTAGRPTDREAADALAETTAAERDDQGAPLEAEILKLQTKLQELHRTASDAKSAADARHDADKNLRDVKLLPGFIRDELNATHRQHTDAFGKELLQLETRQTQIEGLLVLDVESPEGVEVCKHHVSGLDRFGVDLFERREKFFHCTTTRHGINTGFTTGGLRPEAWNAYLAELRTELADVESRIKEIVGGKKSDADAEIERLKAFYVK